VTCEEYAGEWIIVESDNLDNLNNKFASGGLGVQPYMNVGDWMCADGLTPCLISLSCTKEGGTKPVPNFYVSTKRRVVAINFDDGQFSSVVENDENLSFGRDLVFLDQYNFLVTSFSSDKVLIYDVNGEKQGVFAELDKPSGILKIGDDAIAVSHETAITFFDLEGNEHPDYNKRPTITSANWMTLMDNNVLLSTDDFGRVWKICLNNSCPDSPIQIF